MLRDVVRWKERYLVASQSKIEVVGSNPTIPAGVHFCYNFERILLMLKVSNVVIARPVKIVQNSVKAGNQWGQIKDAISGDVLHVGQLPYIKRVARKRYNVAVRFH